MRTKIGEAEIAHWFLAIAHNNFEAANALREKGISLNTSHPHLEMTGLMLSARMGHESLLDWLLAEGAAPSIQMGSGRQTALHLALEHAHLNCARYLLESEANPNLRDALGRTALHYAVHSDKSSLTPEIRSQMISLLVKHGANADIADLEGATPLHYSVIYCQPECTETLLNHGANPNIQTYDCKLTPCHIALIEKHQELTVNLLAHGANPDMPTSQGWTVRSRIPKAWNIALPTALPTTTKRKLPSDSVASDLQQTSKVANSDTR